MNLGEERPQRNEYPKMPPRPSNQNMQDTFLKVFDILVIGIIINKNGTKEFSLIDYLEKFRDAIINDFDSLLNSECGEYPK